VDKSQTAGARLLSNLANTALGGAAGPDRHDAAATDPLDAEATLEQQATWRDS